MLEKDAVRESKKNKEVLDRLLKESDRVFIVAHDRPDMDAIGSAIGMSLICKKKGKKSYIVVDDEVEDMEKIAKGAVIDTKNEFNYIKSSELDSLLTNNSLMIALDVNQNNRVATKNHLKKFKKIFIIDHHKTSDKTIETPYSYIREELSSTCEEISRLVTLNGVKLNRKYANFLLAGIMLDTYKLNVDSESMLMAVAKLLNKGAKLDDVKSMFLISPEHFGLIRQISGNAEVVTCQYAITFDRNNPNRIFKPEDLAQIADDMLNIDVSAVFAIGYTNPDTISISARSNGMVDVASIMKMLNGGGDKNRAATQIKESTIEEVYNKLIRVLMPYKNLEPEPQKQLLLNKKNN